MLISDEKYYIPTIREFHIGFEYEMFYEKNWHKKVLEDSDLITPNIGEACDSEFTEIYRSLLREEIRVKYLDQQDLEECDFKFIEKAEYSPLADDRLLFKRNINEYQWYIIQFYPKYHKLNIVLENNVNDFKLFLFDGIIKNKSELHKLFRQIGINK